MNSKLALGTTQFGIPYGISNKRGKIPKNEIFSILDEARKNNITMLDTAYSYGDSESIIGEYNKINNSRLIVVTKLPPCNADDVSKMLDISLYRLNVNKVYGCLFHDFKSFTKDHGILKQLKDLKQKSKIDKYGFSLYYPEELEYLINHNIEVDIIQIPYNIFDQRFSILFSSMKNKNIEIHIRSIFLQGLFFMNPEELNKSFMKIGDQLLYIKKLSNKINTPISAICLNFALINTYIDKVIIGIESLQNLKENLISISHKNKVKEIYNELLNLKLFDENIILPFNWRKE